MRLNNETSVEIRNLHERSNTQKVTDIQEWRSWFDQLMKKFPTDKVLYKQLSTIDEYYGTISGDYELRNVRKGVAGILRTERAAIALEKWLKVNDLIETSANS